MVCVRDLPREGQDRTVAVYLQPAVGGKVSMSSFSSFGSDQRGALSQPK